MNLKSFLKIISKLKTESTNADFLLSIMDAAIRDPYNNEEFSNPLLTYNMDTLRGIVNGNKNLSREYASKIRGLFDREKFMSFIYNRTDNFDDIKEKLISLGFESDLYYDDEIDVPAALADLLEKIIEDISKGILETNPPIKKITIHNLDKDAFKNAYIKDGLLHINNKTIELPEYFSYEAPYLKCDLPYIIELLKVYSSLEGKDIKSIDELQAYPKYKNHLIEQNKCYYSAEAIKRTLRDLFADGEEHFNLLKDEIYDSIYEAYVDLSLDDGYQRLKNVLEMVSKANLNSTILLNIKGLITIKERKGICHILVNDGRIKSWVEVSYE